MTFSGKAKKTGCIMTTKIDDFITIRLDMEKFAQRLKELREARALTQVKLAEMVGVIPRVYNRWERGTVTPRLDKLIILADILQVTLDELAGRESIKSVEFRVRDPRLHSLYKEIDTLSNEDQQALVVLLDSLIKRSQMNKLLTG
jgi:transcriptional regulator with XRE-family HTH domain